MHACIAHAGWQNHPVCTRRYHFIIPSQADLADPTKLPAIVQARFLRAGSAAEGGGRSGGGGGSGRGAVADAADDPFNTPASEFESSLHHMHGTLHANGYGHLQRMNARDPCPPSSSTSASASASAPSASAWGKGALGCSRLTGRQLMHLWDSLCSLLGAREVSVEDVSNKGGMLLRTLHAAAYGETW